jgi:hypothetical protein
MQKIKFICGWAQESDVVLVYIDPTILTSPGAWQVFGWMTPGGAPSNVTRETATYDSEPQHSLNGHIGIIEA